LTLVGGDNCPIGPSIKILPCHKKNPNVGTKEVYYSNELFIEQEDARTFKDGEEVRPLAV